MTTRDDRRRAAVHQHDKQVADEQKRKAETEAARQAHLRIMHQAQQTWHTKTLNIIRAGVHASSEGFAGHGSEYLITAGDDTSPNSIAFRIVPSGRHMQTEASFTFILGGDVVRPETTARGCENFPDPVLLDDVTQEWVEDVADSVMTAVLGGQRVRIPD